MSKKSEAKDTKTLNEEHERALVEAQWKTVERLGIDKTHPESINSKKE